LFFISAAGWEILFNKLLQRFLLGKGYLPLRLMFFLVIIFLELNTISGFFKFQKFNKIHTPLMILAAGIFTLAHMALKEAIDPLFLNSLSDSLEDKAHIPEDTKEEMKKQK